MTKTGHRWRVPPGRRLELDDRDAGATNGAPGDRTVTEAAFPDLMHRLFAVQDKLWAEARRSLLVVLQGMDASGKDGTIKHVFSGLNPQGTHVASFKQPTPEERSHDFLWRVHRQAPRAGQIGIFNRSHYEDVLVARVDKLVDERVWRPRYELINSFERILTSGGTTLVKIFLHVSFDEQGKRLEKRLEQPDKRWKASPSDFVERRRWDQYRQAYSEAIEHTSTEDSPWFGVPADHKWYRNWAVSQILIETLESMNPRYPEPALE